MSSIADRLRQLFTPVKPLAAGLYHYQAPQDDPRNYRLHLRIEKDGSGVLIVNAATVLHLNQTATEYAYHLVENLPEDRVVDEISKRYQVSKEEVRQHYRDFVERIDTLVSVPDLDPVTYLDFERQTPFSGEITAPYRLDCALTYHLVEGEDEASAPTDRVSRELTTAEWNTILDKAWQAGIPHVVFTGGEPTLRPDLAALIAHAEANNQVSGLLTNGLRLADKAILDELLQTGLDHLMIILQPENENSWIALQIALAEDIFVAVHLTLTPDNQGELPDLLNRLAEVGVKAVSLSASRPDLQEPLKEIRAQASRLHLELVWNLPVPYSALNPVHLELENHEHLEGAGKAWLYVEPDGDVLPAQGVNQVLGNFLHDSWDKIWAGGA